MPVRDCEIGEGTKIWQPELVNLYECKIGKNCNIGSFVEIGKNVMIGNNTSIGAHCFIPEGVIIGDNCFIGPRVTFCNDMYPPSYGKHWGRIFVHNGASIGAGVTIVPGIIIGEGVMIGAGSIVTKSPMQGSLHFGHPSTHRGKNPLMITEKEIAGTGVGSADLVPIVDENGIGIFITREEFAARNLAYNVKHSSPGTGLAKDSDFVIVDMPPGEGWHPPPGKGFFK